MALKHILLDLDGVIADFHQACLLCHGWHIIGNCPEGVVIYNHDTQIEKIYPFGQDDIASVLGLSSTEVWSCLDRVFSKLAVLPFAFKILELLDSTGIPWSISTSPGWDSENYTDKVNWFRRYLNKPNFNHFMIGSQKYLMANPEHLLIDDSDSTIRTFKEKGGQVFLWPGFWNSAHQTSPSQALERLEDVIYDQTAQVLQEIR